MTPEEVATKLAQDETFKRLSPERQQVVFQEAVHQAQEPMAPPTASPRQVMQATASIPAAILSRMASRPLQAPLEASQHLVGQLASIPQPLLNFALPTAGGMAAGLPGMAVGGMAAKGLEVARRDPGLPPTLAGAVKATGEVAGEGLKTAAMGLALKGITGGFHALRVARNVPLRAGFLRSVRQAFLDSKKLAGEAFGSKLDALASAHPTQTVDVAEVLARVQERTLNNPAFKSMLSRATLNHKESALVQSLINQPDVARTLSMQEAQSLKQVVGRMLKQKYEQVSPDLTDAHLDANEMYHGIRLAQLNAFPEFADIAAGYHQALTNFRMVKPHLTPAALEPSLLSRFGNRAEIQEAVRELLPKETVQAITRFVRASLFPKRLRTATGVGVGGLTIAEIIRRTTR